MIIVEGPDGSGKSTLCEMLAARFNLEIGERSTKNRDEIYKSTVRDSYAAVGRAVMGYEQPVIWDRMFYSDPIYAKIVRNADPQFTHHQLAYLHELVNVMMAPVILCMPPLDVVKRNVYDSDQLEGVEDNIELLYRAYGMTMTRLDWAHEFQLIVHNYTNPLSFRCIEHHVERYLKIRVKRREIPGGS